MTAPQASIVEVLDRAVLYLRLGQEGAGADAMATFTDIFWRELSSGQLLIDPPTLSLLLHELLSAQERGDSLWIADLLEHEVRKLLNQDRRDP